MSKFTREELLDSISDEDLDTLMRARASELSALTAPLEQLAEGDDGLHDDDEFTSICADRAKYLQLTDVEK